MRPTPTRPDSPGGPRRGAAGRPALLACLLALAAGSVGVAPAAARQAAGQEGAFPPDSVVLAILKERVAQGRSAGLVVGMLEPDGTTRVVAWGDPGPGQPPLDGESVFEIGSITKVFTGILLADMALAGEVALDDPVQRYLPDGVALPTRNGRAMTLASLSEQNSGLPRLPSNLQPADMANPYADYTVDDLYAFLSGYEPTRDPGAEFEYSNLGVGLLGHVLALRAGIPYEELVRRRILDPLGMTHTAIILTPWMQEHLALGHDDRGDVVPNWDVGVLAGAGGLRSTAQDMLVFLDANLHPGRSRLHRAMALSHGARAPAGSPAMRIGLNWMNLHAGTDTIVWHNGGTGGYRAFAGLVPSKGVGVVVLTNSGGAGADDIGLHLLRPEIPLAPPPAPPREFTEIELPLEVLAQYVGTYRLAPEFELTVTLQDGGLVTQATGQGPIPIAPWAEDEFFTRAIDAQITFERDADGTVTGLVLHQGGQDVPAPKVR